MTLPPTEADRRGGSNLSQIGKTVFHCHILPHEDTGMMQNLLIKPRNQPFAPSIFDPPMHPRLRPLLKMMPAHPM